VLSETCDFFYKCSDYYDPDGEAGVIWNDPAIGIAWPDAAPALSAKDAALPKLADVPADRLPVWTPV